MNSPAWGSSFFWTVYGAGSAGSVGVGAGGAGGCGAGLPSFAGFQLGQPQALQIATDDGQFHTIQATDQGGLLLFDQRALFLETLQTGFEVRLGERTERGNAGSDKQKYS